jgi:aspartyl/glutamyl-tRNA(Asn/Gln) amidotransferase C subunit
MSVDESALPTLVEQMSRILDYVAQIASVPATETVKPFTPGPTASRLRADEVRPAPLAFGPDRMAPAFREGFFLVPRLSAFEGGADAAGPEGA